MTRADTSFYRTSRAYRSSATVTATDTARRYYRRYVDFVRTFAPRGAKLLEVGSSTGTSALCFMEAGYRTTAVDVCDAFFNRSLGSAGLAFVGGDAASLPFATASFDVVTSHQTLEHLADPAGALDEMIRVLRPGGWLFVVGPNLVGIVPVVQALVSSIPRERPVRYWFRREPGYPRYPLGATYPDTLGALVKNLYLLARKQVRTEAEFILREPDFTEPAHADTDSCYLLNPIDIVKYLRPRGFDILSKRGRGPFGALGPLAGGTWVAACKQS